MRRSRWWNLTIRGGGLRYNLPVQVAKGYLFYVDKFSAGMFGTKDIIRKVRVADGETENLLNDEGEEARYDIFAWRVSGHELHFSGLEKSTTTLVTGRIDTLNLQRPVEAYLTITPVASALGAASAVKDIAVLAPVVPPSDPGSSPIGIVRSADNDPNAISIEFTKYMNNALVEANTRLVDGAGRDVPFMSVWFYKTLHLIPDMDETGLTDGAGTVPLRAGANYVMTIEGARDRYDQYLVDLNDRVGLHVTLTMDEGSGDAAGTDDAGNDAGNDVGGQEADGGSTGSEEDRGEETVTEEPSSPAPTVTAQHGAVQVKASQVVSALLTVTQPERVVSYQVFDYEGAGHFSLNGQRQASGVWVTVTKAQVVDGALVYVGGDAAGLEVLWARVVDAQGVVSPYAEWQMRTEAPLVVVNRAPVAHDTALVTFTDQAIEGRLSAWDADGDDLTFSLIVQPTQGSVTVGGNGVYTYTPHAGITGADSFTFQARDGIRDSNVATVSLVIDTPVAVSESPWLPMVGMASDEVSVFVQAAPPEVMMPTMASVPLFVTEASPSFPPSAAMTGVLTVAPGTTMTFAAGGDADGRVTGYAWQFGDDTQASGRQVTHTYDAVGRYQVTLHMTRQDGTVQTDNRTLQVATDAQHTSVAVTMTLGGAAVGRFSQAPVASVFVVDDPPPVTLGGAAVGRFSQAPVASVFVVDDPPPVPAFHMDSISFMVTQ